MDGTKIRANAGLNKSIRYDRAKKEQAEYERKLKAREKRKGRKKGKKPKPPDPRPKANEQVNLTDPDSGIMRKSKRSECRQSYNAQAVVDTETMLILGTRVSKCAGDSNELVADIEAMPEELGAPCPCVQLEETAPDGVGE